MARVLHKYLFFYPTNLLLYENIIFLLILFQIEKETEVDSQEIETSWYNCCNETQD